MLRNLPEGSRYYAAMAVDHQDDGSEQSAERDPRTEAIMDHRVWTIDRRLQAMAINAINFNTAATGMWSKDAPPPDFDTIGPASWNRKEGPAAKAEQEFTDNFDFFRKMGFPLG